MARTRNQDNIITMRRSQLTTAAYRVVSRKGYYNFTIRDIAREAGLSTGLVHYYFKNKEDLLFTLLKEMNSNLRLYLNRELVKSVDPVEKLLIFINQAFNLVETERNYFYVLIDFWTQINHNERIRKANIKLYESYRAEISKILEEGIQKKVFAPADVPYLSAVIISLIQGTIIQYIIDSSAFNYAEYTERIRGRIVDMVAVKQPGPAEPGAEK